MKKEEMVALLGSAGVPPSTIDAMTQAYEMGFEHGARAYVHLADAVEKARDICHLLDLDKLDEARENIVPFWNALDKVRDAE
jgi:hypothetical protein